LALLSVDEASFFSIPAEIDVDPVGVGSRLTILLLRCSVEADGKLVRGCSAFGRMSTVAVREVAAELGWRVRLGESAVNKLGLLEPSDASEELGASTLLPESKVERKKVGQVVRLGTMQLLPT